MQDVEFSVGDTVYIPRDDFPYTVKGFKFGDDGDYYRLTDSSGYEHLLRWDLVQSKPFWVWPFDNATLHLFREWASVAILGAGADSYSCGLLVAYSTAIELRFPRLDTIALKSRVSDLAAEHEGNDKAFVFDLFQLIEHEVTVDDVFVRASPLFFDNLSERGSLLPILTHWEV